MASKTALVFLLKGINFSDIISKYKEGYFSQESPKCKLTVCKSSPSLNPSYSDDRDSGVFTCKDKHNKTYVVATTGHENIRIFLKNCEKMINGRCGYCGEDFEGERVGCPVKHEEIPVIEEGRTRIVHSFWTEGIFCSFECCLGHVRNNMIKPYNFRTVGMEDSEFLLKYMYRLLYPQKEVLRPAPDINLLISNGGSLTSEEWHSGKHEFFRSIKVTAIPAKVEYFMAK